MSKTASLLILLALGSFSVIGCAAPSEEDGDDGEEEQASSEQAVSSAGKVAPACVDREVWLPQGTLAQSVRITNNCKDKAHPDGYTARVRIEYGIYGKRTLGGCMNLAPGATRTFSMKAWEQYWHTLSC